MKKIKIMLASLLVLFGLGIKNVSALNENHNQLNIDTNESYFDENGNYYNPETGEYFYWSNPNSRATSKVFSFKIQKSVTSNSFKLKDVTAKVKVYSVKFEKDNGSSATCCSNHRFTVNLRREGLSNNEAVFYAPFSSTKTVSLGGGFSTSASYVVQIGNNSPLPNGIYLVGSGEIAS